MDGDQWVYLDGRYHGAKYYSHTNNVTVCFYSDAVVQYTGFLMGYTAGVFLLNHCFLAQCFFGLERSP